MGIAASRGAEPRPRQVNSSDLATVDEVARAVIQKAQPVHFETARDEEQRRAAYRLRCEVVIERGWANPEDLPDGLEQDEFDRSAVHILGWHAGRLVATSRIVFPSPGLELPTERAFGITVEPKGQVADMSRQIARPLDGMQSHRIFAGLLGKTWLEIRKGGFALISGDFTNSVQRLYQIMGFEVTRLGPAREFWGETRYPILVDVAKAASKLRTLWGEG
jgi:N-acyl-L-homoserine lactone synthetase